MILYNEKIRPILDDLENPEIELAGGSAVGMVLSITDSLISYICNLTIGKKKYENVQDEVIKIKKEAEVLREKALKVIDEDRVVLDKLLKAFKVRKEEPEKLEEASKECVLFCNTVMEDSLETLKLVSRLEKVQKENYTFKQLFEKFKEAKMLTKEEAQLEKKYHIRPSNKPFGRNYCRGMTTAFHNSKELYDKVYKELRASDFNKFIKESQKGTSAQRQMVNLYMNLDKFALEEDLIDKGYAQYITAVTNDKKQVNKPQGREPEKEKVFTYEQIDYLWNFEAKSDGLQKPRKQDREIFIRDFWLMLLYCGCRADELLSVYTANVFLDKNYFVGGLKTEAGINRTIPIHPAVKHLFEKYYNPQNEFLFTQPNGNRIDYDYYLYHYQHNFYNLHPFISDHTSHDCRHTLRTELENLNIKQVIINSIIGHSNDNVGQDIYTHIPLIEKQEAINMVTYKKRKNLYIIAANQ